MADEPRAPVPVAAPRSNVYTVLLGISLAAMILGCLLLGLDFMDYGESTPPPVPAAGGR
jgi:hypothetical protein